MMREGIHPETPRLPFTPGWDLVGVVDRLGDGFSGIDPGQRVAALPINGAYAEFVCLPPRQLPVIPVTIGSSVKIPAAVANVQALTVAEDVRGDPATARATGERVVNLLRRQLAVTRPKIARSDSPRTAAAIAWPGGQ